MLKRFKKWLFEKFLPDWCKEKLIEENDDLKKQVESLKKTIDMQKSYIDGMKYGFRAAKRINNKNGEV